MTRGADRFDIIVTRITPDLWHWIVLTEYGKIHADGYADTKEHASESAHQTIGVYD